MKKNLSILFFGRKNCYYTNKIKLILKKKCRNLFFFESNKLHEKLNLKKIKNKNFDYIICFRSYYIINTKLLKKCKKLAINFHPGTPEYRGIGSVNFALYNNSKYYGSTAHLISKQIDYGKIIDIKKFRIPKSYGIEECLQKTYSLMYKQAKKIIFKIFDGSAEFKYMKNSKKIWSNKISKKSDLEKLYEIKKNVNEKELKKLLRATVTKKFKPFIRFYGKKFVLMNE